MSRKRCEDCGQMPGAHDSGKDCEGDLREANEAREEREARSKDIATDRKTEERMERERGILND